MKCEEEEDEFQSLFVRQFTLVMVATTLTTTREDCSQIVLSVFLFFAA
jgi:predicted NAD/FAD-binding protein